MISDLVFNPALDRDLVAAAIQLVQKIRLISAAVLRFPSSWVTTRIRSYHLRADKSHIASLFLSVMLFVSFAAVPSS